MADVEQTNEKQGVVWDLTSFFPQFNGPEMVAFKDQLESDVKQMQQEASALDVLSEETADSWEGLILRSEDADARMGHVYSFVGSQDSKPSQAARDRFRELESQLVEAQRDFQQIVENDLKSFEILLVDNNIPRIIFDRK